MKTKSLYKRAMDPEEMRQLLELRRSSAASRHLNKKKYNRKKAKRSYGPE